MSENIKTRKYYRVHNGTDWDRMHFVTDANSVDANDGDNMETKVGAIKGITTSTEVTEEGYAADATTVAALNSSLVSFQNGVDTLYNKCVSLGVTPTAKTPDAISTAIQTIYTNRYNAGYAAGDKKHSVYAQATLNAGGTKVLRVNLYVDGSLKGYNSDQFSSSSDKDRDIKTSTVSV